VFEVILIGDEIIPCEETFMIFHKDQILETKANSTVIFNYNQGILQYTQQNDVSCAVVVSSITQAIYCNALNAKYIIAEPILAQEIQKIAENYMFDSKVLALISSSCEIEEIARKEIDGVIYKDRLL
jgi:hypothetical protein